jgi:hypothetical protein
MPPAPETAVMRPDGPVASGALSLAGCSSCGALGGACLRQAPCAACRGPGDFSDSPPPPAPPGPPRPAGPLDSVFVNRLQDIAALAAREPLRARMSALELLALMRFTDQLRASLAAAKGACVCTRGAAAAGARDLRR